MNPILQQILLKNVQENLKGKNNKLNEQKILDIFKINLYGFIKDIVLIGLGVLSAGFGLKSFLLPSSFLDGGVTGISLLVSQLFNLSFPVLLVVINIPFIALGYTQIGKSFAVRSIIAILCLSIVIAFVNYPIISKDTLLVASFGGFFLGLGIGLAMRGGAVLDGTEILAIYLSKKTGLTIGDVILIFNILIFMVAAYLLSPEIALYAILTYMAAAKTVDFVIEGVEEYTGVTIISKHSEELREMITEKLQHGVSVYKGQHGYGKRGHNDGNINIIYTAITRLEVSKLKHEVDKIDPKAFIVMNRLIDTKGGMIKKRRLH